MTLRPTPPGSRPAAAILLALGLSLPAIAASASPCAGTPCPTSATSAAPIPPTAIDYARLNQLLAMTDDIPRRDGLSVAVAELAGRDDPEAAALHARLSIALAHSQLRLQAPEAAIRVLAQVAADTPYAAETMLLLAQAYLAHQDNDKALLWAERTAEWFADEHLGGQALLVAGSLREHRGEDGIAAQHYQHAADAALLTRERLDVLAHRFDSPAALAHWRESDATDPMLQRLLRAALIDRDFMAAETQQATLTQQLPTLLPALQSSLAQARRQRVLLQDVDRAQALLARRTPETRAQLQSLQARYPVAVTKANRCADAPPVCRNAREVRDALGREIVRTRSALARLEARQAHLNRLGGRLATLNASALTQSHAVTAQWQQRGTDTAVTLHRIVQSTLTAEHERWQTLAADAYFRLGQLQERLAREAAP